MKLLLASAGSYPRIGDTPELQELRKTHAAAEKGQATPEQLKAAEDAMVRAAIKDQEAADLDVVTDGLIRWADPISHFAGKLEGVEIGGLLRYFDTNFYFRQPVVKGEIKHKAPIILPEFEFARACTEKKVKAVLTGPFTLAQGSLVEHAPYKAKPALVQAYAQAIAAEVEALAKAGAEFIQVDEPGLLKRPGEFSIFQRAIELIGKKKGKARLGVGLYYGDWQPLYEHLQKIAPGAVDFFALDFTYNPKLIQRIVAIGSNRPVVFGVFDGRNTQLEDPAKLAPDLDRMMIRVKGEACYLSTSCGLELLPRAGAQAKLKLLSQTLFQTKVAT